MLVTTDWLKWNFGCARNKAALRSFVPHSERLRRGRLLHIVSSYQVTYAVLWSTHITMSVFNQYDMSVLPGNYASDWDSPYLYWWLVSSSVNSLYTYAWDIKMDWGLLDKHPGENTFLREEVVYSSLVSRVSFYIC